MINEEITKDQAKRKYENERYEIAYNSDEWKIVEFHLKSSIPSEIKIDRIVSVKNTLTYNQFEFLTNNHLWSYGWYNLKGDDYDLLMKEMREKSFKIPETGANFKVGAIFDSSNNSEVQSVYVLCKIIIGKSFCRLKQEGEKESPPQKLEMPYESYMYCSPEQTAKSQKMSWSMTKPYSYYIKNKNFIEPLYAVFFSHIDSYQINLKAKYMCAQCKTKEATVYCKQCVNCYCSECNKVIHYSDNNVKNVMQHKEVIDLQFTTRPGKCVVHPENDSEYYCEECKRAICGYCRFKGPHSKGLQSQHQLEDIYISFQKTQNQNQNQNQDYEDKKKNGISTVRKITEQIKSIDQKMQSHEKDINKDFDEHRKLMETQCKNAKLEVFEYICALREIQRNLNYFNTYFKMREKYLQEQNNNPELAFIWSIHEELIQEYLANMEELKKVNLRTLKDKISINIPNVAVSKENFGFNKTKVQTEVANKRNIQKNDGFDQKQKDENYSIIEKTRNLLIELRKKRKQDREKEAERAEKEEKKPLQKSNLNNDDNLIYEGTKFKNPNDSQNDEDATTINTQLKNKNFGLSSNNNNN